MEEEASIMKRRALILETLNSIPVFTGQDTTWSLEEFRTKFLSLADYLHLPENDQLFAAQQRLAGLALQTSNNFKHNIKSIKDLFEVLGERFESNRDQGDLLNDFWSFKQQPEMSVSEFLARAQVKANAAIKAHKLPADCEKGTKEQWLVAMLLKNLIPQIRRGVVARNPKNLQELEEVALLEEKAFKAVPFENSNQGESIHLACAISPNKNAGDDNFFRTFAADLKMQLNDLSKRISEFENNQHKPNTDNIICHYCKFSGHIRKYCPELQFAEREGRAYPRSNEMQTRASRGGRQDNFSAREGRRRDRREEIQNVNRGSRNERPFRFNAERSREFTEDARREKFTEDSVSARKVRFQTPDSGDDRNYAGREAFRTRYYRNSDLNY